MGRKLRRRLSPRPHPDCRPTPRAGSDVSLVAVRNEPRRTIFVGDIHGCCAEFEALIKTVAFTAGHDRLLLTGDAFTRGPDPLGVWQAIQATGAEMVLGNHETWLLPQLRAIAAGGPPDALDRKSVV